MATRQGTPRRPGTAAAAVTTSLVSYPKLLPIPEIQRRLQAIISDAALHPEDSRNLMAARTVATMLYGACISGQGRHIRPSQVTSMSDAQYAKSSAKDRDRWWSESMRRGFNPAGQWYRANTREGVRDDTLRNSLVPNQAVVQLTVPVTSSKGRYALSQEFARLFDPELTGEAFSFAVSAWQSASLGAAAQVRHVLLANSSSGSTENVTVRYPDGSTISLSPGPSSDITKAVVEEFSKRFLSNPAVIWLSESGNKVPSTKLISALKLRIDPAQQLPDLILADVPYPGTGTKVMLTFVEVVHSDGPINDVRRRELVRIAEDAGFDACDLSFVTAFNDRAGTYRSLASSISWGSFVWFRTEPDNIIYLREGGTSVSLKKLLHSR